MNIVNLETQVTITHADSNTIGYRTTEQTKVNISNLQGYPTGKTILCAIPHTLNIYGEILWVDADGYLRGASACSETINAIVTVFYLN